MGRCRVLYGALISFSLVVLAGCGGGHGASAPIPQTAAATAAPQSSTATLALTLNIPSTSGSSTRRFPKYVSSSAKGLRLTTTLPTTQDYSISLGSSTCPLVGTNYACTFAQTFPIKTPFSLTVQIYDTAPAPTTIPAGAQLLATGTLANVSIPNGTSTVAVTLDGVPTTIETVVTGTPSILPQASAGAIVITPRVRDASGAIIIGNAPYGNASGTATPITLSISPSITGYTLAVQTAGATAYGAAGTTATLVEPGDTVKVSASGIPSGATGVVIGATQGSSSTPIGILRVPVDTSSASAVVIAGYGYGNETVEAVPLDQAFGTNALGQGVIWAAPNYGNGSVFYNPGRAGGNGYTCGALNTIEVGMAPGLPAVMNVGSNGGRFYFYAVRLSDFAANCSITEVTGTIATLDSFGSFCPTTNNCYFSVSEGGWGYLYVVAKSTVAGNPPLDGIAQASYVPGAAFSTTGVTGYTVHNLASGSGLTGIAVLPGMAVGALLYRPGIAVEYAAQNQLYDGGNLWTGGGGLVSPVALPDGTIYALTSTGNLARCHINPNPNVMTGQSCDASYFATLNPPAYAGRSRTLALGPDGALWYATATTSIGRYDLSTNANTSVPMGAASVSVIAGNDGHLYATDSSSIWSLP